MPAGRGALLGGVIGAIPTDGDDLAWTGHGCEKAEIGQWATVALDSIEVASRPERGDTLAPREQGLFDRGRTAPEQIGRGQGSSRSHNTEADLALRRTVRDQSHRSGMPLQGAMASLLA